MSLDDHNAKLPHPAVGVKHTATTPPQNVLAAVQGQSAPLLGGAVGSLPPTVAVMSPSLAARLEALATNIETKLKADDTKAKHLFEVYWPALAALLVGFVIGHFTHIL